MSNRIPAWIILSSVLFSCAQAAITHRMLEDGHDHDHDEDHDSHDSRDNEDEDEENQKWGEVIGTTLLVNAATLIGVITIFPCGAYFFDMSKESQQWAFIGIPAFAVGALIATTVFLIVPEAIHLVQDDGWDENTTNLFFGLALILGVLLPTMLSMLFPIPEVSTEEFATIDNGNTKADVDEEESVPGTPEKIQELEKLVDMRLCASVILGDAAHNFADGIFIGAAFKLCDSSQAYAIVAGTIYHELAQELADFFLLTRQANLSKITALLVNFISGLSVVLGGIIITAIDISATWTGIILAMSAGVYLHVAMTECMPRVQKSSKNTIHHMFALLMIALGVVPIGLVLLVHEHCEGGHNGHDH